LNPYLSLAIGACEATPLEMASAYTVFPNLGIQPTPYFINKIEDYNSRLKESHIPESRRVLEPETAGEVLDLLQNVIQNGTARAAAKLNRPLGGKTGTTNDFTDAWFIGFTPSITAAVWIGYDRNETLGNRQSGGVVALPIWIEFMEEILKDRPVEHFKSVRLQKIMQSR
jgi:penicillin-binding protein 1A